MNQLRPMYITDLTHFLDKSGAIAPVKGPARAMAQFLVNSNMTIGHHNDNNCAASSRVIRVPTKPHTICSAALGVQDC